MSKSTARRSSLAIRRSTLLAASLALGSVGTLQAASIFWDLNGSVSGSVNSGSSSGTWNTSTTNWTNNSTGTVAPQAWVNSTSTDQAVFSAGSDSLGSYGVTISGTVQTNKITVDEGNINFTGTSTPLLQIGSGGIAISANAGATFGSSLGTVQLANNQNWNNSANNPLTINAAVSTDGSARTLTINGAGSGGTVLAGALSDNGAGALSLTLNSSAAHTTTLSVANSYTGGTSLTAGNLVLGNKAALGTGSVAWNGVVTSASTALTGANAITNTSTNGASNTFAGSNSIEFAGTFSETGTRTLTNNISGGTLTFSGGLSLSSSSNFTMTIAGSGNTLVNSVISGGTSSAGTLAAAGTGTLTLTRANTYISGTNIRGGTMKLDFSASGAPTSQIVSSSSPVTFDAASTGAGGAATLIIQGKAGAANVQNFNAFTYGISGGSGSSGVAAHLNLVNAGSGNTISSTFTLQSTSINTMGSTLDISRSASDTVTLTSATNLNGIINTSGGMAQVTLNGTDWAAVDGSNRVVAATYVTAATSATTTDNLNVNASGTLNNNINTLRYDSAAALTTTVTGTSRVIRGILVTPNVGANTTSIGGSGSIAGISRRQLTIVQNNTSGSLDISATIRSAANTDTAGLVKSGAGRLILSSSSNPYFGRTYINEGQLRFSSNAQLGWTGGTAQSQQMDQGVWGYSYTNYLAGTLEATGASTITLDNSGTFRRSVTLANAAATIDVAASTTLDVSGGIVGAGSLTKTGTGTLTLSGANASTGNTTISAGTVNGVVAAASSSQTATPQGLFTTFSFTSGTLAGTSVIINNSTGIFGTTGLLVSGVGIPGGTTITSWIDATHVTLSNATTANSDTTGYVVNRQAPTSGSFASGASSMTVGSATGLQIGQQVFGPGINPGTFITSISGTTIGLSVPTSAASTAGTTMYGFGGASQVAVTSATGLVGGQSVTATGLGVGTIITGIKNNILTLSSSVTQATASTGTFGAYQGLSSGSLSLANVAGANLDMSTSSGTTTVASLSGGGATGGNITLGTSTSVLAVGTDNTSTTYAGALSGNGGLTKTGGGTLTLSGGNSFSGPVVISAGTLTMGSNSALGATAGNTTIAAGAVLDLNGTTSAEPVAFSGVGTLANYSASPATLSADLLNISTSFSIYTTGDMTVTRFNTIGAPRVVIKDGPGKLTTNGSNHNNLTNWMILNGTVEFANTSGYGADRGVFLSNGTLRLSGANSNLINDAEAFVVNGGIFDLNGKAEAVAAIEGTGGVIRTGVAGTATLKVGGGVAGTSSATYAGVIENGSGVVEVTKEGTGTQTFSGTHTYSGTTFIANGQLKLTGTGSIDNSALIKIATGAVFDVSTVTGGYTLGAAQTLAGTGSVKGSATINGTLAPGASPGTLNTEDLSLASSAILSYDLNVADMSVNTGANDLTIVTGNLTIDGTLNLTLIGGSELTGGSVYRLFDYTGSLTDNGIALGVVPVQTGYSAVIDTSVINQVNLTVVAIPEPATVLSSTMLGATLLTARRRRRTV